MTEYMNCLKLYANDSSKCRGIAKDYLACRMERGLMAKESMENLGFHSNVPVSLDSSAPFDSSTSAGLSTSTSSASAAGPTPSDSNNGNTRQ